MVIHKEAFVVNYHLQMEGKNKIIFGGEQKYHWNVICLCIFTLYFFELLERNYICFLASYSLGSVPIPYGSVGNDSQFIVE